MGPGRRALAAVACVCALAAACGTPVGTAEPTGSRDPAPTHATAAPTGAGSADPSGEPSEPPTPVLLTPDELWARLFAGDVDFAAFPSIEALAGYATAVVVARMQSIREAPPFKDEYGNRMFRAAAQLEVETVLHGSVNSSVPGAVTVQVVLGFQFDGGIPDPWQAALANVQASLVNERAILFLVDETTSWSRGGPPPPAMPLDPTLYSVFASNGFIRDDNGVARPSTLTRKAWTRAIDGRPFDDVVAEVAATKPAD